MARFVINPETEAAWTAELQPGVNTIGRAKTSSVVLDHESVGDTHCVVTVDKDGVVVEDSGSTAGTMVAGEWVTRSRLRAGDELVLGKIRMRFEHDPVEPLAPAGGRIRLEVVSGAGASTAGVAPVAANPPSRFCLSHPRLRARFRCPQCGRGFCDLCVDTHADGERGGRICRTCRVACEAVAIQAEPLSIEEVSFAGWFWAAFRYPFVADGVMLLAGGTLLYGLLRAARYLAAFAGLFGAIAVVIIVVFGTGYFTSYLRNILTSSCAGERKLPDWPEYTDFGTDILSPFLQLIATVAVCFLPAFLIALFAPGDHWAWQLTGEALAVAYFPMAFMAVANFDTVAALNPMLVAPSMWRAPKHYAAAVLVFALFYAQRLWGDALLGLVLPKFLAVGLSSLAGLYLLVVSMRLLGTLYHQFESEFGWSRRR